MTMMIILTEEEAAQIRGPSAVDPLAELDPVLTPDGFRYMLPVAVLDDPAHAEHHDFLAVLPQEDIPPPVYEDESETEIGFGKPKLVSRRGRSAPDG
jgi:hypothetical protein